MKLYPFLKQRSAQHWDAGYDRDDNIPADSVKPEWEWELKYYIGYQPIVVSFPSFSVYRGFVQSIDFGYQIGGSYDYLFLSHLLPHLKKHGIVSSDYVCHSNNKCNRIKDLNELQISPLIIEWIDALRYHFLTLEQFCDLDFNEYFNKVNRGGYGHFRLNLEYLTKLHLKYKKMDNKYLTWRQLTEIQKRHRLEDMEEQLRTNPLGFATRHFELMTRLNSDSRERKQFV